MTPTVTAAIISTSGAILIALGGFLGRTRLIDNLLSRGKGLKLAGTRWRSTWQDTDKARACGEEILVVEEHRGSRVLGYIVLEGKSGKRWDFEGNFNSPFLQLVYYPSEKSSEQMFRDYGCYFFQLKGNGYFDGYSMGYSGGQDRLTVSKHQLNRI